MTSSVEPQRIVAGRYRLLRTLGSGAHGTVDLAEDLLNGGRRVAVKRLEAIVGAGDPEPAAEVLRWFLHPRWAEVLDEGRLDAHGRFQVTRYVPGHSLDRVELPRPSDEVFRLLEDGARVLRAIHRRGLVHYDVTLGNFLREETAAGVTFTLTDGGLASVGPVRGIARGSPAFMAPEVLEGAAHDHRADLFSLGLVAWRLATGSDPHGVGGAGEVLGRRRRSTAPRLRQVRPDAPEGLERVLAALLERDPQRRPADGDALLALLAEAGWESARTDMLPDEAAAVAAGGRLVGRAGELARFREACRALTADVAPPTAPGDAEASRPARAPDTVLVVHGPSGSGATRLLREMAAAGRSEGVAVLSLSGRDGAADRRSALRRLADGLSALASGSVPVPATAEARDGREHAADSRNVERFVELTERVAERTPLALLVEDFAELPAATQEGIRVLSRHLLSRAAHPDGRRPPRVLLVVDHGPEDPTSLLIPDADEPKRPCVPLAPLSDAEASALVAERLPGYEGPAADVVALRTAADGLPGAVVGLLAEGLRRGDVRRVDVRWIWVLDDLRAYRLPRSVSPSQQRTLDAASPTLRRALACLALFDEPVPTAFLEAALGRDTALELAASPLVSRAHEADDVRLAPASRALRAVLRDTTGPESAAAAAAVLGAYDRAATPELAADVARVAVARGDAPGAVRRLLAAGPSLRGAPRARAASALADCITADTSLVATPAARRGAAELLVAGPDGAALGRVLAGAMLAAPPTPDDDATRVLLAENAYSRHEYRRVLELLTLPLTSADPVLRARADAVTLRARVAIDPKGMPAREVRSLLTSLWRLGPAARAAHPSIPVGAFLALTRHHFETHRTRLAEVVCRRALARSRRARDPHLTLQAYNNLGIVAQTHDTSVADRAISRAVRIRLALGEAKESTRSLQNLARLRQKRGRDVDAASILQRALSIAVRHADYAVACSSLQLLGLLYEAKGNTALAASVYERMLSIARATSNLRLATEAAGLVSQLKLALGERGSSRESLVVAAGLARRASASTRDALFGSLAIVRHALGDERRAVQALRRITSRRAAGLDAVRALVHDSSSRRDVVPISSSAQVAGPNESDIVRQAAAALARTVRQSPSGDETSVARFLSDLTNPPAALSGAERRVIAAHLVGVLRRSGRHGRDCSSALRAAIRVAAQSRLRTLEERLRLVLAAHALRLGDTAGAADSLSAALATDVEPETAAANAGLRPSWEPAELAWTLREFRDRGVADVSRLDARTQLHAIAHRMSLGFRATRGGDTRVVEALRTTLSLSAQLRTAGGLEALLEALTDCARRITRAERACVVLVRPDGTGEVSVVSSAPGTDLGKRARHVSQTIMKRVLSTRQPLILHDVYGDSELLGRPSVAALSLRSALCVPLIRGDRLFGAMYADSRAGAGSFDRVDLEVLLLFAEQAAAAIETARLLADVQRSYAELKSTQERLVRGERLRVMGELASGVAHEFNNLLTAILARVQLLALEPLPQRIRGELSLIQRTALDAAEVVRRLQGFSKAQRQSDFQRVDVGEVCADVVEFLRPLWAGRRLKAQAQTSVVLRASRGLMVNGDPTELREVVTNLLKNAVEALDAGGVVVVSAAERAAQVVLTVEDDGPGIPAEHRARLFTPFFTTKGEKGTGLGLCLSQQIVERHGGEISIQPRAGGGTTAQVVFPVATPLAAPEHPRDVPSERPGRSLSVVVVDDDPNVLDPLCGFLRRSGIDARAALSAEEALSSLEATRADVVISDVGMPGMSGLELCRTIRDRYPTVPVILMSGRATAADAARVDEAGAAALLAKPFTMRQVLDLLAQHTDPRE